MSQARAGDLSINVFVGPEGTILFPTLQTYTTKAYGRDTLYSAVLGRLVSVDAAGNVHPGLLESFEASDNFRTWTLRLRAGLTFHNGRKVDASDLEYSLMRYVYSERPSPGKMMRVHIENVRILDDRTVVVKLRRADPHFHRMIAGSRDSLVPKEEIDTDHFSWKRHPVGAGPYRIVSVEFNGNRVATEQFEKYFSPFDPKAPARITFLNSPRIESTIHIAMGEKINPGPDELTAKVIQLPATVNGIFFNFNSPLGRNEEFRAAVALTVRRSALLEGMSNVTATTDLVPSNLEGRLGVAEKPDLDQARSLFEKVAKGIELVVPVPGVDLDAAEQRWMRRLEQQFKSAGVTLNLKTSTKAIFESGDSTSPFFLVGFIPDVGDPFTLYRVFREGGPWVAKLPTRDEAFESMLDANIGNADPRTCSDLLTKLGRRFHEKHYAVPLFEQKLLYWVDDKRIENLGESVQRHIMVFEALRLR